MRRSAKPDDRVLLVTMTKEPFQPVRIYFEVSARPSIIKKLRELDCMLEDRAKRCWQWLFHAEAASLQFVGAGYEDVPKERRPIIIGRIRFPKSGDMTLQTNSIERAIQGARFLASRLGQDAVAIRCRVVNRCFAADEGTPDELMKELDRNVAVIDPRNAEMEMEADFKGARSINEIERAAAKRIERDLKSGKDVPLVEDFPLAPEEETADFQHLSAGLQFRFVRAVEHWRGNTHLTLTAIILRTVEKGMRAQGDSAV